MRVPAPTRALRLRHPENPRCTRVIHHARVGLGLAVLPSRDAAPNLVESAFGRVADPSGTAPKPRPRSVRNGVCLSNLLALVGASVGGAVGWWLGAPVGTMTAFLLSMVGTALGVYAGRRIAARLGV